MRQLNRHRSTFVKAAMFPHCSSDKSAEIQQYVGYV